MGILKNTSEWHFLRYLGYHRAYLSKKVLAETGGDKIYWRDSTKITEDRSLIVGRQYQGLEFIKDQAVQAQWKKYWPQTVNLPIWNGVAQIRIKGRAEWLLVGAYAFPVELLSHSGVTSVKNRAQITNAFNQTCQAVGNANQSILNWWHPYYDYSSRLAILNFLMNECDPPTPTRLIFVYFFGQEDKSEDLPRTPDGWRSHLEDIHDWLGINPTSELLQRVHNLHLSILPEHVQ